MMTFKHLGYWWDSMPLEQWPEDPASQKEIRKNWDDVFGDRCQKIVFIGIKLNEKEIRKQLDDCLLKTNAFTPDE
ncbi:GTP-binding protein [Candidatus Uabimicrobium amorphum]|uniref:GTP-binding protein n=2 Tax=Uabimicrobium amorphum TaxID=2596890 RepID=A0A5S9F530_UABAM|nr:GTP-binding protein [Candidatus Uabimicrobium amorphum]